MPLDKSYDFIFFGAGCASLSILVRMIDSGKFADKNILLVDKEEKTKNDRTWCFWEEESGYFEAIVYRKWSNLLFKSDDLSLSLDMAPYQYKMIRGLDFYKHCFAMIRLQANIDVRYGEITFDEHFSVKVDGKALQVNKALVFNSIYLPSSKKKDDFYLLQHFKGWIIETETAHFNPAQGTLMDFNVRQNSGTTFAYVLPLTTHTALVEYTLFSKNLLKQEEYNHGLRCYIEERLNLPEFKIIEEEFGVIPMTNATFTAYEQGRYNIGTAGGQTKASTGYTFKFIQEQAGQIVQDLIAKGYPSKKINNKKRFYFYDSTLLHILSKNILPGKQIFTTLFKKNRAVCVFKFLDNETTVKDEIKIINTLPKIEFLSAGIKELIKMFTALFL